MTSIAIIGAGPIGLEAALHARFRGYQVDLYDRGRVAENLRRWGHVRMFSPFGMNVSHLGIAALHSQDPTWRPPDDTSILTGRDFVEAYLAPLAKSDLVVDSVHENVEVLSIGRSGLLKTDWPGDPDRADEPFHLLLREASGERIATADIVIDASGAFPNANWLGAGGIPALGELSAHQAIEYGLPDILGEHRPHYANRRVLVVGSGYSAATTVVALAQLAVAEPQTQVVWTTRHDDESRLAAPIARIPNDRLAERDALAAAANELVNRTGGPIAYRPGTLVERIERASNADAWSIILSGRHAGDIEVDRIVANVGYRPDRRLYDELQIHECYATSGPMKLAAALLGSTTGDCLDQTAHGPQSLLNPEPNFFILGAKSYGRSSQFLLSIGQTQIRDLFDHLANQPATNDEE